MLLSLILIPLELASMALKKTEKKSKYLCILPQVISCKHIQV